MIQIWLHFVLYCPTCRQGLCQVSPYMNQTDHATAHAIPVSDSGWIFSPTFFCCISSSVTWYIPIFRNITMIDPVSQFAAEVIQLSAHKCHAPPPPPHRGGGGGTSICMHIGYVPRERPPFSALNFRSGAYHFYKLPKKKKIGSGFCRSGDHHFQKFFNFNPFIASHGRLSPICVRQRRGLAAVPEICIFTLKTDQARSGAPHFHAQNGSSSFRSHAFSRSKRLKLVPEPHIFTLDRELVPEPLPIFHFAAAHTYQNLGVSTPPPPRAHALLTICYMVLSRFVGYCAV